MPISSTSVQRGDVEYEPVNGRPKNIHVDGQPLSKKVESCVDGFRILIGYPYDRNRKKIIFDPSVEDLCIKIFVAIKEIKVDGQEGMAAHVATKLNEQIAIYWVNLLSQGKDILGIDQSHRLVVQTSLQPPF
jgi:hypothetical protein